MKVKHFPVHAIVIEVLIFIIIVYISAYNNKITWDGFAVDENGLLYIGHTGEIDVIDQDYSIYILDVPTTRGFQFTIENGDTITVYTGAHSYKLDLAGNILEEAEPKWNLGIKRNGPFTALNGLTYYMVSPWGRPQIMYMLNGAETIVYQMPLKNYIGRILFIFVFIGQFYCVFTFLYWKYRRSKKPWFSIF